MGDASVANFIEIRWPSGKSQSLSNVPARQILTLVEPGGPVRLKTRAGTEIQIEADADADYVLETFPDLNSWTALPERRLRTDSRGKASLPIPTNNSQQTAARFFRARTL